MTADIVFLRVFQKLGKATYASTSSTEKTEVPLGYRLYIVLFQM